MKKWTWKDAAALLIWLLPLVYLLTFYNTLPDSVPVHFDSSGQPDRYGSRTEFLWIIIILTTVSGLAYLLLKFLPSIDPRRTARYSSHTFKQLAFVMLLFLSAINIAIMYATTHGAMEVEKFIFPLIGLLFTYIGNIMHSLKPNYFVGIRTPWTLESEDTWRKTHQFAGKLWLPGGLLITLAALLLPAKAAVIVFVSCLMVLILIPVVYSYIYYKKGNA